MIFYRLTQDHGGLLSGSSVTEDKYKVIHYVDKPLWEPILDHEVMDMIVYDERIYCAENGIECMLFYNQKEFDLFINKIFDNGIVD